MIFLKKTKKYCLFSTMLLSAFSSLPVSGWIGMETNLKIGIIDIASQAVLYQDNFDRQPNWKTSFKYGELKREKDVPIGWDFGRTGEAWHPDFGDVGSKPSLMINGNNPEQIYGGKGKSLISYTESYDNGATNGFVLGDN
ncbi:hypothetical protein [sulfur-oxidizing endosymbiont of Gigantopelta aegis]|uniref:hypothetical protein n=1 Tax=sulfur-oxidizing endosymbiont of Gigantopelta aegis TaxID=2794934 RepID=UPI0018DB63A9|nr:hypothetical protein [sulfur-oxidizing endosymbiont of Gigantopelta aegis]